MENISKGIQNNNKTIIISLTVMFSSMGFKQFSAIIKMPEIRNKQFAH